MTTKSKVAAALVAAVVLLSAWLVVPRSPQPPTSAPTAGDTVAAQQAVAPDRSEKAFPAAPDLLAHREVVAQPAPATTGSLLVRVVREADRSPAVGEVLLIGPQGQRDLLCRQVRTDAAGEVLLADLAPGRFAISMLTSMGSIQVDVVAGERRETEFVIPRGVHVRGKVVDGSGLPVAGAEVEGEMFGRDALRVVAVTGADGRFELRDVFQGTMFGARAPGFAAARLQMLMAAPGGERELTIELLQPGGSVTGVVLGPDGEPVDDAIVRIGEVELGNGVKHSMGMTANPLPVRTAPDGSFRVLGLAEGEHPVLVRSSRFAGWTGTCLVTAGGTTRLPVSLAPGVTCTGVVSREDGAPAGNAYVDVGRSYDPLRIATSVALDGTYVLTGVTPGSIQLRARHGRFGVALQTVQGQPGETVTCDLVLSRGQVLRGRVLDDAGNDAAGVMVEVSASNGWNHVCSTDEGGWFELINCPPDARLHVTASRGEQIAECEATDVRQEVELRLPAAPPPSARTVRIRGRVLEPDGAPAVGLSVSASDGQGERIVAATSADGWFEMPPCAPGRWGVHVSDPRWPRLRTDRRELGHDAEWDVGTLQLVAGGSALVEVRGAPVGAKLGFDLRLAASSGRGFESGTWIGDHALRTHALAPGDYVVRIASVDRVPAEVPFTIRAGEEARAVVPLEPGTRQIVRFVRADGAAITRDLAHDLHRGDGKWLLLPSNSFFLDRPLAGADGGVEVALCLQPGEYRITAREGDRSGSATFAVGASEGPPLRVVLQ